jgi:hypothetical protein
VRSTHINRPGASTWGSSTCAESIYQRSLRLPDPAAREAVDFIDFLLQRDGRRPSGGLAVALPQDTCAFLAAVAGSWWADVPDDIDDSDLTQASPRDML